MTEKSELMHLIVQLILQKYGEAGHKSAEM